MPITASQLPLNVAKPQFRIFLLAEGDNSPLADFLESLKLTDLKSHDRLISMFKAASEHGPNSFDIKRCRKLKAIREDIYELKTNCGKRVLWFYDAGKMILCTHAFTKPGDKVLRNEAKTAIDWMNRYHNAKTNKQLTVEFL